MKHVRRTCVEALSICIAAVVVGLVANSLEAKRNRLDLFKDYFNRSVVPQSSTLETPGASETGTVTVPQAGGTEASPASTEPGITVNEDGMRMVSYERVLEYFDMAAESEGFVVFVDARDDESYAEGHIPGALQVNHYKEDQYLPQVFPALREAGIIIVYCSGGDCEDSLYLAASLINEHGISYENVYVYEGGTAEWVAKGQPTTEGDEP